MGRKRSFLIQYFVKWEVAIGGWSEMDNRSRVRILVCHIGGGLGAKTLKAVMGRPLWVERSGPLGRVCHSSSQASVSTTSCCV